MQDLNFSGVAPRAKAAVWNSKKVKAAGKLLVRVDRLHDPVWNSQCESKPPAQDGILRSGGVGVGDDGALVGRYTVRVWGALDLRSEEGVSLRPKVRKSCALLAVLALSDGHRQTRKWLQSLLWSGSDEARGAGSLRQELARLKKILGNAIQSDNIDIWLEPSHFNFDHLDSTALPAGAELLQGIDVPDEAFEDWLREQRQVHAHEPEAVAPVTPAPVRKAYREGGRCLVVFECDTKGSLDANVAAMFFSEQLYQKLTHYDVFSCIGHDTLSDWSDVSGKGQSTIVVRIAAIANRDEVCLGVQIDNGRFGPRLGYQSVVLPIGMMRLRDSAALGRLVVQTTDVLLDSLEADPLASGTMQQATILANEARKLTFKLDRESLAQADRFLARAYELDPRGQYVGWRAFLRNTAFFQHRTTDIFDETFGAEELSLEAMAMAPDDAMVQAFSSQLEYVNQGNLVEPMIRARRAVELDPTDPLARALLSNALTVNGRVAEGFEVALQSVSLAAGSPYEYYFHHFACMAATAAGDYQTALAHARESVSYMPDFVSPRRYEVALAQQLGDEPGVRHAVRAMQRTEPTFTIRSLLNPSYPVNTLRRLPLIDAIK